MADRTENSFLRYGLLPACILAVIGLVYGLRAAFQPAETTLATALAAGDGQGTRLRLEDGSGFAGLGKIKVGDEQIEIERIDEKGIPVAGGDQLRKNPDTFQVVARGANGTPVSAHAAGATVAEVATMFFPENNASYGEPVDRLFFLILWITGIAFILTEAFLLFSIIRFRGRPDGRAAYSHGNHRVELVLTIVPALILVGLAILQSSMWTEIKIDMPKEGGDTVVVHVLAKQFEWNFRQVGADGAFGTVDDIVQTGELHVPVGRKVLLQLRSPDVIHSFFLPNFRLKQDVVPGMKIPAWFQAERPGVFQIMCAELCGLSHTNMKARLHVLSTEEYAAWVQSESARWSGENEGFDRPEWYGSQAPLWWWWDQNELQTAYWDKERRPSR